MCRAYVLYDRPPEEFKPISLSVKHDLFMRLSKIYPEFSSDDGGTAFTKISSEKDVVERVNRPGILVSSTSWTEDEDFGVLLSALCGKIYQNSLKICYQTKKIWMHSSVVTGVAKCIRA